MVTVTRRRPGPSLARVEPLAPPTDPRSGWHLPAPGDLPRVEVQDELTVRVLAPNPSPMSLDGTNTYVIGEPGSGAALVLDPGPDDPGHLAQVEAVLQERDAAVRAIVVTHHHVDHAEAARGWAVRFGVPVTAASAEVAGPDGRVLQDGDRVPAGGMSLEVVATPGHTGDHVAFRSPTGALFTGDHVLGRGTSVVAHPDGDLEAYLASLRRVLDLGPDALLPGHGPALTQDPTAVLRFYADHRAFRLGQLRRALRDGPARPAELVARIYRDVDPQVLPAAEASTRAALAAMARWGELRWGDDDRVRLDPSVPSPRDDRDAGAR